jgi:mannose-6-phosphate isomerase-like protein (cupin superfamily)
LRFFESTDYMPGRPWAALDIAEIEGATVRLHWTDAPYVWHRNDGEEVFLVVDGAVDMHYRVDGEERVEHLTPGRICHAEAGDAHVAVPTPEARILVVERRGSE